MSSTEDNSGGRYDDVLTTHNYDGIQEYDNPMPSWWMWIFIACCVWAAVYFVGINIDMIPDTHDKLAMEMAAAAEQQTAIAAVVPPVTSEMLEKAAASDDVIKQGEQVFTMNCAACHGNKGQGLIGPNLTDDAWLYGGALTDIHHQVENGKPDNGMPAWGDILVQDDQLAVVAYVNSLRGTNPPDPKPPQGEIWKPEGADDAAPAEEAPADDAAPAEEAPADETAPAEEQAPSTDESPSDDDDTEADRDDAPDSPSE